MDGGRPVAAAPDISAALAKPVVGHRAALPSLSDDFRTPAFGERWSFENATPNERARATFGSDGLLLRAVGSSPADSPPLATRATDLAYEIEVEIEVDGTATGALLLYFNQRLFCGMAWDGERMTSYAGGTATYWQQPVSPGRVLRLKLVNDHHIVTGYFAHPGEDWIRHEVRYDTSGYHATTMQDLKSLRPGLAALGDGQVRFRSFRYSALS